MQPPKLPSIWKGGCKHIRFEAPRPINIESSFAALSPSCRRAQKFAFQAIDQPVEASPRLSNESRAPWNNWGVLGLISSPGYKPQR